MAERNQKSVVVGIDDYNDLLAALKPFADAPSHGIHGGPMTTAILVYEDGTDEDSARHRGRLSPQDFERAKAALNFTK